jgi:hypothetical protein
MANPEHKASAALSSFRVKGIPSLFDAVQAAQSFYKILPVLNA